VTFGDWIAFLRDLPPAERARHLPRAVEAVSSYAGAKVELVERRDGGFQLTLQPASHLYTVEIGEPIHYAHRKAAAQQDGVRMLVSGIAWNDALAYAAWLDRPGRLAGARPCDDHEWERAARGADGRLFPNGDRLAPDDADSAETYGRSTEAFGPDEVG